MKRLHPRQYTDWAGEFALVEAPDTWKPCRIVDISSAWAGIQLADVASDAVEGTEIVVRVHLRGVVRHAEDVGNGSARAGIEFTDVTEHLRVYLASFSSLQVHW